MDLAEGREKVTAVTVVVRAEVVGMAARAAVAEKEAATEEEAPSTSIRSTTRQLMIVKEVEAMLSTSHLLAPSTELDQMVLLTWMTLMLSAD